MREIKFRAWHKESKTMLNIWPYEWKDGVYESNKQPNKFFDNKFEFSEDKKECNRLEGKSVFLTFDGAIVGLVPISDLITRSLNYSDEYDLMQFTGLKVKDVDIFEGDILRTLHFRTESEVSYLFHKVVYDTERATFNAINLLNKDEFLTTNGNCFLYVALKDKTTENIGNIYSNPELLK